MPSKKQYNLVNDDAYDSRIPLYNEEAFQHGITFHAKYIGSLEVPRPSSRVEIVAAMRRIRYEFKAKSIKKKKVSLTVSVDGVKVSLRSKRRSNQWPWDENKFVILHHPIYRIFYVSHDSQDLKIFSYIARDGGSNAFKCNVFKSKKKSQAMRIVRTIGQAFEVCHKLSLALGSTSACPDTEEIEDNALHDHNSKGKSQGDGASEPNSCDTQEETTAAKASESTGISHQPQQVESHFCQKNENELFKQSCDSKVQDSLSVYQHIQMLKDQLEQQNLLMKSVVSQVQLLKEQLTVETSARLEAQNQNQQLLAQNKELLEHIQKLVKHINDIEERYHNTQQVQGLSMPETFLSHSPALNLDASLNQNIQALMAKEKTHTSSGLKTEQILYHQNPETTTSFQRQLSVPVTHQNSINSTQLGVPFNSAGVSLPCSPSRLNFSPNLENIFKPDSFVCSSPKESRKAKFSNPLPDDALSYMSQNNSISRSPSFSQSSISPSRKSRKQESFDFDPVSYSPLLFSQNTKYFSGNENDKLASTYEPDASNISKWGKTSKHEDSFIAQVTKDLARMSSGEKKNVSETVHRSFGNSELSFYKN